MSKKPQN